MVSKDWEGLALHALPQPKQPQMGSHNRPDPVRMKDSDDYITERAANPRTGLISPSVGSRTPCRESTPNTPGDALKLNHHEHTLPTLDPRRVLFSRANEGRKISAGSIGTELKHGEHEWVYGYEIEESVGTPCTLPEDKLIVHMPSAKEPQPFAYPGYSSGQIKAFEHYRDKARRVSNEGYDQRFLQDARIPPSTYSTRDHEHASDENDSYQTCSRQAQHFRPYNGLHERPQPQLVVRKRNAVKPVCQVIDAVSSVAHQSGQAQHATKIPDEVYTIIPPDMKRCTDTRHGSSRAAPGAASKLAYKHKACEKIPKKSCVVPRSGSVAKGNHDDKNNVHDFHPKADSTASDMTDLRTLPRVTLVRPGHAATPVSRGQPPADGTRKCSLGCQRDISSGQCLEQRKMSHSAAADRLFSTELPNSDNDARSGSAPKAEEVLVGIIAWLLCYVKGIQLPQSDLVETLRSQDATAKEKADALKATLSLVGHVLAVGTALAMIWQLSAAVIQLLQIAFWPLAVPFKILRWVMGAA